MHRAEPQPKSGFVRALEEEAELDGSEQGRSLPLIGKGYLAFCCKARCGLLQDPC